MARRRNQAVVVIHGIGEQRPMDTLRGFVEAVLEDVDEGPRYFSKPDRLSQLFELRKIQNRRQPRTHFYEYYWAYQIRGTRFAHVFSWLRMLLFRRPRSVPLGLRPLWGLTWLLIALALAAASVGVAEAWGGLASGLPVWTVSIASAGAGALLQTAVLGYFGDAARYLSPQPENIALRRAIRADGIKLLRKLHEGGKYDRIVLVGHSLGSVIAYDLIRHYWPELNDAYRDPERGDQPELQALEIAGGRLRQDTGSLDDYRRAQPRLWRELRDLGHRWLVTDLVTLGSPLAHAAILLADGADGLREHAAQRELPTSPPIPERTRSTDGVRERYSYELWDQVPGPGGPFRLCALHHAAPFAPTRWTNLYVPAGLGLFGDFVGGPVGPWLGPGIKDVAVRTGRWKGILDRTPLAHSAYWWRPGSGEPTEAVAALVTALDLDGKTLDAGGDAPLAAAPSASPA
jgi:hypothetical protein